MKDPQEVLSFEYQLHHLSNHKDIIIGNALAKYNWYYTGKKADYVFRAYEKTFDINTQKMSGDAIHLDDRVSLIGNSIQVDLLNTGWDIKSWAMINPATDEPYFIVNNIEIDKIYFKNFNYSI